MAGPYLEHKLPYDVVYGYDYNRIVDALTNTRQGNTVAMMDQYDVCFGYQPLDAVYKARCRFEIHTNVDTLIAVQLHFTLQPFHVGNQTTAVSTTSSGGTSHSHSVSGQTTTGSTSVANQAGTHVHTENLAASYTQNANTSIQGPEVAHDHNIPSLSVGGATSTAESTHTHTIPSLSLNAPTAIYEAGMAQGVHAFVNGVDRTIALGGPWGSGSSIDITDLDILSYVNNGAWNEIQFSSTSIGGITAQIRISALLNGSI